MASVPSVGKPEVLPEWMHCDVQSCRLLEEVSGQIASDCRIFGDHLQGVCGGAMKRLQAEAGTPLAASVDDCTDFLSTFANLSTALLAVAVDLERMVLEPLGRTIATLVEESTGRAKHLQQVRRRFAELQERYARTRQKTLDAKCKLAGGEGDKRWRWRKSTEKTAVDQHTAVCDLARCEEELLESEACLRKLEDDSRERLQQLDCEKKATLRRVLQQGRSSLRRLLRVADKVPPLDDFQGVMPGADNASACLQEVQTDALQSPRGHALPAEPEVCENLEETGTLQELKPCEDRFARYLPGPDLEDADADADERDVEVSAAARAAGWSPDSSCSRSRRGGSGRLVFESEASLHVLKAPPRQGSLVREAPSQPLQGKGEGTGPSSATQAEGAEADTDDDDLGDLGRSGLAAPSTSDVELQLSPLIAEQPQRIIERYMKRLPENLAAAAETSWDKLQGRAAEQPLGSLVGKLEVFWIHQPGRAASAESADGLVCFQFVQGHAAHYARILHLSVAPQDGIGWPQALRAAIAQVRRFIFTTLPVQSLRVVVLAAEDDDKRICIDRDVEIAYKHCHFRWFQLTQRLRRAKSAFLRHRKSARSVRFLVLHSPRMDEDPPAPRDAIGTKPALKLQSQNSQEEDAEKCEMGACQGSHPGAQEELEELSFTAW
ncbi:unnamed protein product [Symbiodinium natans]|uniref:Uncharacterized protein n=1 Tax=Symbiodinium natans TaxID=878477 RepID=A0A812RBL7_9DINO|nr:unnamed protein product [Symbiodinium natans]